MSPAKTRRGATAVALALTTLLLAWTPTTPADEIGVPAQAHWDSGEFLIDLVPPRPAAAICLVDTGVTGNADTAAVVARLALDSADLNVDDGSPTRHGTAMSMFIAAPRNGYGMVGAWPAARIVSVRANGNAGDAFTTAAYVNGIKRCMAVAAFYRVRVIELALAQTSPVGEMETAALADAVQGAIDAGISVVAAAGNTSGGPVGSPANVPGVLSVGAADASGSLCQLSAAGAGLRAPGCGLDAADPRTGATVTGAQGTSPASAITAAAVSALHTYRPDLSPAQVEAVILGSATRIGDVGRVLNVAAAFRAAGLASLVDAQPSGGSEPPPPPPQTSAPPAPRRADMARLPRPVLRLHASALRGGKLLTIAASNRPAGAVFRVRILTRRGSGEFARRIIERARRSGHIAVRVHSWQRITARFVDPEHAMLPSRVTTAVPVTIL